MLTKLEEVTQAALAHVVQGDVLDEMLRQITRLVDADTSAILLLDEDGKFLTVRAALGFDCEIEHAVPIPFGQGMAGRVAASAKPVVIRDLDQVELASPHLRERGIKSLVAIPIMVGEQVIGVAHAGSVETAQFDEADMRLLRLMADRIALAITQSQAYEDERRARHQAELAHRRLAFLAEASTLLATSLDYESTLGAVRGSPFPTWPTGASWTSPSTVPGWSGSRSRTSIRTRSVSSQSSSVAGPRRRPIPLAPTRCCAAERPNWRPRFPRRCSSRRPMTTSTSRSSAISASARTCACRCGGGTVSSAQSLP